jgi:hypothetical protein
MNIRQFDSQSSTETQTLRKASNRVIEKDNALGGQLRHEL